MTQPQTIDFDELYADTIVDYGLDIRDDTLHERNWIADEEYTFRIANRNDKTNILVKIDKDLV